MQALMLAVLLSQAADVPLIKLDEGAVDSRVLGFTAGEVVPFDAICMDNGTAVKNAQRIVSCETTVAEAEKSFLISKPVLILGIVGLVAASLAAGVAIGAATK